MPFSSTCLPSQQHLTKCCIYLVGRVQYLQDKAYKACEAIPESSSHWYTRVHVAFYCIAFIHVKVNVPYQRVPQSDEDDETRRSDKYSFLQGLIWTNQIMPFL